MDATDDQARVTYEEREKEEKLRESACNGDIDCIRELLLQGVNINSQNSINGW